MRSSETAWRELLKVQLRVVLTGCMPRVLIADKMDCIHGQKIPPQCIDIFRGALTRQTNMQVKETTMATVPTGIK